MFDSPSVWSRWQGSRHVGGVDVRLTAGLVAATLVACGGQSGPAGQHHFEEGKATYYADSLAGKRTASGQPYDPSAMTAAHRTLAFGTIVHAIRDDGRFVEVRINDRGPFGSHGAIINLSRSAADKLGMVREGIIPIRVRVVRSPRMHGPGSSEDEP